MNDLLNEKKNIISGSYFIIVPVTLFLSLIRVFLKYNLLFIKSFLKMN